MTCPVCADLALMLTLARHNERELPRAVKAVSEMVTAHLEREHRVPFLEIPVAQFPQEQA